VYRVGYTVPLATIRISLLCIPLFYHSYHGTALPCPSVYRFFYIASTLTVACHMITLLVVNPISLEAMLPSLYFTIDHLHELRRIWWSLWGTVVSSVSHVALVAHVRSSAPATDIMRSRRASQPSLYFLRASHEGVSDVLQDFRGRLRQAKEEWTARWHDFHAKRDNFSFAVLVQLFAYQDVIENGTLNRAMVTTEYVPQLLNFLLHGAVTQDLEEWILLKCKSNLEFAHAGFWYLRAWCNASDINEQSQLYLDQPAASPTNQLSDVEAACGGRRRRRSSSSAIGSTVPNQDELVIIHRLLVRIQECGEEAARQRFLVREDVERNQQFFGQTPMFLDQLLRMAEDLFVLQREHRKKALRQQLVALQDSQAFMSSLVYIPFVSEPHRICRLVPEESIAISTKERVPCIIYVEILVDVEREKSSKPPLPPKPVPRSSSSGESTPGLFLDPLSPTAFTRSLSASSPLPDKPIIGAGPDPTSERERIREWREKRRAPLRRQTLLSKVSTTVQNNVQQLRNHAVARDRTISEELQSLTMAETFLHKESNSNSATESPTATDEEYVDAEGKMPDFDALALSTEKPAAVSRSNSNASVASMGQWSSPDPKNGNRQALRSDGSYEALNTEHLSLQYGSEASGEKKRGYPASNVTSSTQTASARNPPVVFREDWATKEQRVRSSSPYGGHPGWRLVPVLVKANDDLRQEQLASQLIFRMASILARENVPVWLHSYNIMAVSETGGVIEAIPDTISIDSLKKNDAKFTGLKDFFDVHFNDSTEARADAKANFVESLAAYSIVCFLLQIKDRHNGNILLDRRGHLIHIDFGFFFLSSPGKNAGFESAPFKLTRDFVEVLEGPNSHLFRIFRDLCVKTFIALRRHCTEIILLVEMLKNGNEQLKCFRGRPDEAIQQLRERFRLDLNDRACKEYVNSLVDDSIENWRTDWYDRYQRYFVGVL